MKKLLFIFLIASVPFSLSSQTITGRVYRAGTDSLIQNASVYYSGSLTGTSTNSNGEFSLFYKAERIPLIISCVGYNSAIINEYSISQPLKVYLEPKLLQLKEVVIRAGYDGMSRADKERIFIREFIGTSEYAASCKITNIDDIDLVYSKKAGTLKAYCNTPVLINNKKLGYQLSYYLDEFIKSPKNVTMRGNFVFKENTALADKERVLRNRENVYKGSRMQFIRSLCSGTLLKNKFNIYTPLYVALTEDSLVSGTSRKVANLRYRRIIITYNNDKSRLTYLSQVLPDALIGENGFYNSSLTWSGFMGIERIGDMLPYEYQPVAATGTLTDSVSAGKAPAVSENNFLKENTANIPENVRIIDQIVMVKNTGLDNRLVVKKWQKPVVYKIYGTFGSEALDSELSRQADAFFRQLSALTGLKISKTENGDEANFSILVGKNPDSFAQTIDPEALSYLKLAYGDNCYYTASDEGLEKSVQFLSLKGNLTEKILIWMLQKSILKGFGFFKPVQSPDNSIFYNGYVSQDQFRPFDAKLIKAVYNPLIKSGMGISQMNEILIRAGL